jgi:hypothetical protein
MFATEEKQDWCATREQTSNHHPAFLQEGGVSKTSTRLVSESQCLLLLLLHHLLRYARQKQKGEMEFLSSRVSASLSLDSKRKTFF